MSFETVTIGDCTLYRGDCLEVMPTLGKVDAIITDPPYSEAVRRGAMTRADDAPINGKAFVPFAITADKIADILALNAPNRWCVMFCDWRHAAHILQDPPVGYRDVRFAIWNKPNGAPQFTGDRPAPGWEAIAILHNKETKLRWNGGGSRSVWTFNIENQNGHPTPKPLPLMQHMVSLFTDEYEKVLDPFMGSGTTLVACAKLGRKGIGIELEPKYFDIACKRVEQAYAQPDLFIERAAPKSEQGVLV